LKKRFACCLVGVVVMAFGMAACGGGNEPNKPDDQQPPKQEKEQQPVQAKQAPLPDEKEPQHK